MGACCTCQIMKGQKFDEYPVEDDDEDDREIEGEEGIVGHGDYGAHVRVQGSSKFMSMFTQQGRKGVNQDAMTVWEVIYLFYSFLLLLFFTPFPGKKHNTHCTLICD